MKKILFIWTVAALLASCKKESDDGESQFYGRWKTSYGDTIRFYKANGKPMIEYNNTMNPQSTMLANYEFSYTMGKLAIKDGITTLPTDFRVFQSFTWMEPGRSFEVLGMEWFMFISSSTTKFTFTKIL